MLEKTKRSLEQARESLSVIVDKIEDGAGDFAEETQDLWGVSKKRLAEINEQLGNATEKLHSSVDDVKLQGHLAAMDAHDQWQHLQHSVAAFARQVEDKTKPVLDHAQLQAHLAKMDTRDFIAKEGEDIAKQFVVSKSKVEEATFKASVSIKQSCEGFIAGLPK